MYQLKLLICGKIKCETWIINRQFYKSVCQIKESEEEFPLFIFNLSFLSTIKSAEEDFKSHLFIVSLKTCGTDHPLLQEVYVQNGRFGA